MFYVILFIMKDYKKWKKDYFYCELILFLLVYIFFFFMRLDFLDFI